MPLRQNDLRSPQGAKRPRKRIGRGRASGTGTYSGCGLKGQKSRSGSRRKPGFEGGQVPLIRKMPHKRGFRNHARIEYTPINLFSLSQRFAANDEVTADTLAAAGLLRSPAEAFKILAAGDIDHPLTLRVARISPAAKTKIEATGGTVEELHATSATSPDTN